MQFCPKCNNILDISRSIPKTLQNFDIETPTTVSNTSDVDKSDMKVEQLLDKILNNEEIPESLKGVDMVTIQKNQKFVSLNAKQKKIVQAKITELHEFDIVPDDGITAYRVCRNCMYFEPIKNNTLIISRINKGASTAYRNIDRYRNMIYNRALPRTRAYICPNKECESMKNHEKREAVFFRPFINSYESWYTCCACQKFWKVA